MKTQAELQKDIVNITMKIHNEFPGISKYIREMPENLSGKNNNPVSTKNLKEYYNSLEEVVLEYGKTHDGDIENNNAEALELGYPPSEDIYNQQEKEESINPEDISKSKSLNEKGIDEERLGDGLDVPGSELDDQQESVGSEDEENNYYSLGGDNHKN